MKVNKPNTVAPVNPVAKNSRRFNKAQVFKDKKKEAKKRGWKDEQ